MRHPLVRRYRTVRSSGDSGIALPMVIAAMFVLTAFLLASLSLVVSNLSPARADQDSKSALAAAQAGIDEYISRLTTTNGQYWVNGNADATNAAFDSNPATAQCDGPGRAVPGAGADAARYCYRLLTTSAVTASQGFIELQVTGTSQPASGKRPVSRTLTTTLRPDGFIDFIYFTDVEVLDPQLLGSPTGCRNHYYNGRSSQSGCTEIQWGPNDVIDGPLHSNDALQIGGSVWYKNQRTESSWDKADKSRLWWGSGTPRAGSFRPVYAPTLPLPAGNEALLKYVQPKVDADPNTDRPGCLYTGATRIIFEGTTMKVWSPNTISAPTRCLTTSNRANEQTKAIPPVIYVMPATGTCTRVGYPRSNEWTSGNPRTTDYNPCRGTAFVQGQVDGQVTVSGQDDVVVTGNLTVQDRTGTDIIGLVAGNFVWIYHPLKNDDRDENLLSTSQRVNDVDAAILSLRRSILVQNWHEGDSLGNLNVFGAMAQKFRGPVGTTGNTGYDKNYVYDRRLQVLQPPYFLAPDNAPWRAAQMTDGG